MNELSDLLQRVVDLLRQTQIPHMIAGSFASIYEHNSVTSFVALVEA